MMTEEMLEELRRLAWDSAAEKIEPVWVQDYPSIVPYYGDAIFDEQLKRLKARIAADGYAPPSPGKVGTSKAGVNNARKVECTKSRYHGHYPENEGCPICEPERAPTDPYGMWAWVNGTLTKT
jgi:hypothetical protein